MFKSFQIFLVIAGLSTFCFAQELPPVQNFLPEEYIAENQNWDIIQGSNQYMYVANNSGLLEYDGARWRLYESPNKTIIRAVASQGARIYTGAYMEFGYWEPLPTGLLEYHSLSQNEELDLIEDEQFWNIFILDDLVLFQSLNRIYTYNTQNNNVEIFTPIAPISRSFQIDKSIYLQQEGLGLYQLQDGKAVLISDASAFKDDLVVNVFKSQSGLLAVTAKSGFFSIEQGKVSRFLTPSLLNEVVIYSCLKLSDSSFMLGTISKGLIHLDKNGNFDYLLDQQKGIHNNTVLCISEDEDANIWLGLDNGISVVNSNSAFEVYRDTAGKLGAVYTASRAGDFVYLGTNQGLFYRDSSQKNATYQLVPGTKGQVWSLTKLGQDLLCGHHEGTFTVEEGRVKQIADIAGTWEIQWLDQASGLAIQGNYSGLYVLKKTDQTWELRNKIAGFDISSRYFGLGPNNTIYVSHEYKGVFKIQMDASYRKVLDYHLIPDLPPSEKAGILSYKNDVLYVNKEGVFKLNLQLQRFELDPELTELFFSSGEYTTGKLTYDKEYDRLWVFNAQEINYLKPGILADEFEVNRFVLPAKARRDIPGFENITALSASTYLLGNATGYFLFDLNLTEAEPFSIRLRGIENASRDGKFEYIDRDQQSTFVNDKSNFRFQFSVPKYDKFRPVRYQYRLHGYLDKWSDWSTDAWVSYENLPYGDYSFEARARIGENTSENILNYEFTIKRPWYFSIFAMLCYGILIVVLIGGVQILNQRYYRRQKQRLIDINRRKIDLARSEKERQIVQLENEKLQQDVASKNRELAASTLNLVKKNELLNTIKKELSQTENTQSIKPVIQIINKNLDPKKDWEFFKEAFNNADKDFLKKVKRKHPKLTPNDLKLCAYLRLNLSSKEIAPLLNISVRSVEIKRYRLRKKMDLSHEDGLVEYILAL